MTNQELQNEISDIKHSIETIEHNMVSHSDINELKKRLNDIEKKFQWLKDEIIGYLHNGPMQS